MAELHAYSERRVRAALAALPDGRYEASDVIEAVDSDLAIRVAVTIAGDSVEIDFAGTAPQYRREPQLPARRHALGLLLRRAPAHRSRHPGLGRGLRTGDRACAGGLARQRPAVRPPSSPEYGDLEPDHRCRPRRVRAGGRRCPPPGRGR